MSFEFRKVDIFISYLSFYMDQVHHDELRSESIQFRFCFYSDSHRLSEFI